MLKSKEKNLFLIQILFGTAALFSINWFHISLHGAIEYIIFFIFYIMLGRNVFKNAALDFVRGKFMRESFLMTIATIGAIILHQLPEALAVLVFYRVGNYFEDMAVDRSKNTIASLMAIRADYANIKKPDGTIEKADVSEVKLNDEIIINPFEKVPLDSVIIEGESWLDTKALTGESMPRSVKPEDEILAGSINGENRIKAKVIRIYAESSVAKILKLVEEASSRKANIEQFISRFAGVYTPIVVFGAIALTVIPTIIYGMSAFNTWFERSLTLLVVSCPCAFMVGIPLTYFASIGRASKMGVIVKGGVFLDLLSKVKMVVFDKTGTLTKGEFSIKNIFNSSSFDDKSLLKYAAYAEKGSSHPIALSIVNYYKKHYGEINESEITVHKDIGGKGVIANIDGHEVLTGGKNLLKAHNVYIPDTDEKINVFISIDSKYAGGLYIDDNIKDDALLAIESLKNMKIKTGIISGDTKERVESFAKNMHIDLVKGGCLPEDKVISLEEMMKGESETTVFIGDGINDAPSLARADVGIAMGGVGSDAAVENADVVIMDDKPSKVSSIIKLAKKTRVVVIENVLLAFVIKIVAIGLGAFGIASMWMAIFADTGVTAIVVFNAIRLLYPIGEKYEHVEIKEGVDIKGPHCNCGHCD